MSLGGERVYVMQDRPHIPVVVRVCEILEDAFDNREQREVARGVV